LVLVVGLSLGDQPAGSSRGVRMPPAGRWADPGPTVAAIVTGEWYGPAQAGQRQLLPCGNSQHRGIPARL